VEDNQQVGSSGVEIVEKASIVTGEKQCEKVDEDLSGHLSEPSHTSESLGNQAENHGVKLESPALDHPVDDVSILQDIEVLSTTKVSEDGLVKEVMEEICSTMRILKEEVVDISIRKSMRKSTISNLSSDEVLTELTSTDIVIVTENVQPVEVLDGAEDGSASSSATDEPQAGHVSSSLNQGVVLAAQRLEELTDHNVEAPNHNSPRSFLADGQLSEFNREGQLTGSKSEQKLFDMPAEGVNSTRRSEEADKEMRFKSSSQHSLGHLLSFKETTKKIELGVF
jgi:hypothetical protein